MQKQQIELMSSIQVTNKRWGVVNISRVKKVVQVVWYFNLVTSSIRVILFSNWKKPFSFLHRLSSLLLLETTLQANSYGWCYGESLWFCWNSNLTLSWPWWTITTLVLETHIDARLLFDWKLGRLIAGADCSFLCGCVADRSLGQKCETF